MNRKEDAMESTSTRQISSHNSYYRNTANSNHTYIIERLQRLTGQLQRNDTSLDHFEPIQFIQSSSPRQQQQHHHQRHRKNSAQQSCQNNTSSHNSTSAKTTSNNHDVNTTPSHHTSSSSFALHVTSFGLFENEEFQKAFRDCLEAVRSTTSSSSDSYASVDYATTSSAANDDDVDDEYRQSIDDSTAFSSDSWTKSCHVQSRGEDDNDDVRDRFVNQVMNATNTDNIEQASFTTESTEGIDCERTSAVSLQSNDGTTIQEWVNSATDWEQQQRTTANNGSYLNKPYVRKITLRALPEPDMKLALDAISNLCNVQEVHIVNCPHSQCISVQDITELLLSFHSNHCNYNTHRQQQEYDRSYDPNVPNGSSERRTTTNMLRARTNHRRKHNKNPMDGNCKRINNQVGGLRRLNIATRIQVKNQQQIEEFAAALQYHAPTLEYISIHIVPRCASIEYPDMNLNSVLRALSSSTINSPLRVCRIVLGYDHNPFGKPFIKPKTIYRILSNCNKLQKLQLDNFGLTNDHIRVVTKVLRDNYYSCNNHGDNKHSAERRTLALRELQLARNQHYNYPLATLPKSNDTVRLRPPISHLHVPRVFTPEPVNELCQTLQDMNFTLTKLCLVTSDEMRRLQESYSHRQDVPTNTLAPASPFESLVQAQLTLNMLTRLNKLGRFELFKNDSEQIESWIEALASVSQVPSRLSSFSSGTNDTTSGILVNTRSEESTSAGGNAVSFQDIEALSVAYTLIRSNPTILGFGGRQNVKHQEIEKARPLLADIKMIQHEVSTKNEMSELRDHVALSTHIVSDYFENRWKNNKRSTPPRLLPDCLQNRDCIEANASPLQTKFMSESTSNDSSSLCLETLSVDSLKGEFSSALQAKERHTRKLSLSASPIRSCRKHHQRSSSGWLHQLRNTINNKAVDIIKRLDIRTTESERRNSYSSTISVETKGSKSIDKDIDAICDATEEDDDDDFDCFDHDLNWLQVSVTDFDDDDSLSRYKANPSSSTKSLTRRGTRNRNSAEGQELFLLQQSLNSEVRSLNSFSNYRNSNNPAAADWEAPSRIPPPLLATSRNEVHPLRYVMLDNRPSRNDQEDDKSHEHVIHNIQKSSPKIRRILKRSSY